MLMTKKFRDANPKVTSAVYAALSEAEEFINKNPGEAAQIYIKTTNEKRSSQAEMTKFIADPDNMWTTTPQQTMTFANFMHKVGTMKRQPASWKDLYMPESHELKGGLSQADGAAGGEVGEPGQGAHAGRRGRARHAGAAGALRRYRAHRQDDRARFHLHRWPAFAVQSRDHRPHREHRARLRHRSAGARARHRRSRRVAAARQRRDGHRLPGREHGRAGAQGGRHLQVRPARQALGHRRLSAFRLSNRCR